MEDSWRDLCDRKFQPSDIEIKASFFPTVYYWTLLTPCVCLNRYWLHYIQQKLKHVETISEELLEQRQQELEEKFPERKELDLDAPWQMDLLKLQRKVK